MHKIRIGFMYLVWTYLALVIIGLAMNLASALTNQIRKFFKK